jgi:hypothetical protein
MKSMKITPKIQQNNSSDFHRYPISSTKRGFSNKLLENVKTQREWKSQLVAFCLILNKTLFPMLSLVDIFG